MYSGFAIIVRLHWHLIWFLEDVAIVHFFANIIVSIILQTKVLHLIFCETKILSKLFWVEHSVLREIIQFALNSFAINGQYACEVCQADSLLNIIALKKGI